MILTCISELISLSGRDLSCRMKTGLRGARCRRKAGHKLTGVTQSGHHVAADDGTLVIRSRGHSLVEPECEIGSEIRKRNTLNAMMHQIRVSGTTSTQHVGYCPCLHTLSWSTSGSGDVSPAKLLWFRLVQAPE